MKVLLATEGSSFSEAAIDQCCRMLERSGNAEIRVLTVIEPKLVAAAPGLIPDFVGDVESSIREIAEKTATDANARIFARMPSIAGGLTSRVAVGIPAQVILDEAAQWGADLIVVGSHGFGFWEGAPLGSVSSAVVNKALCSVLVVRPAEHDDRALAANKTAK